MKTNHSKVVVIGAGAVGSTAAFSILVTGIAAEVVLVDVNGNRAKGEALDMHHSIDFLSRNVNVHSGGYEECANADIVVITAAAPFNGESTRLDMLYKTEKIVGSIVPSVMASGFDGIFVIVSNPVDIISYQVLKLSGLPKERVIGTGTALESARLKAILGEIINIDPRSIDCYVMGEHGDSMMVPWSHVRTGGKNLIEVLKDNPDRFSHVNLDNLTHKTKMAGWEIMDLKGNTSYGIGSAVCGIVRTILHDENKMMPVSVYLDGEYGEHGIFCGVPAILNRNGLSEIAQFHLSEDEMEQFHQAAATIRENTHRLTI